tara:strand:+ start:6112 stop:7329 length:1218 start_codon:yes stop_codon:yes gene_type:complete
LQSIKIGYLQCIGGISGDMFLGALIDAGVKIEELRSIISLLPIENFNLSCEKSKRGGIEGTLVKVNLGKNPKNYRNVDTLINLLENSSIPDSIVLKSKKVIEEIGLAEKRIHGNERADLHELGTADTLVDIVGSIAGLDILGIEELYCSPLPTGSGTFQSHHGPIIAPAPASAMIIKNTNIPTTPPPKNLSQTGEMITPTGTAIVAITATFDQPAMTINNIGYGLGSRNPSEYPNIIELRIGHKTASNTITKLKLIETNIDDMNHEIIPYVCEQLLELGCRDVWTTPVNMKKGRPGIVLSVLASADIERKIITMILRETTTLGVRVKEVDRYESDRSIHSITSSLGHVRVKAKLLDGAVLSISPEFEDCRKIAIENGYPLLDVMKTIQQEASQLLVGSKLPIKTV